METFLLWIGVLGFLAAMAYFVLLGTRALPGGHVFHTITAVITGWWPSLT